MDRAASSEANELSSISDSPSSVPDNGIHERDQSLTRAQLGVLFGTVLIVALCGIVYELLIASVSSYLLGDSVLQFSITIGIFMFAMGIGSFITRCVRTQLIARFVAIETTIAIVGGISAPLLFYSFPLATLYKPMMYLLILLIGILVGLEIPIITRIIERSGGLRRSLADVLALDYLGALVGAIAFPLFLLPSLGLFRVSFGVGLLNAGIAVINIIVFREHLRRPILAILSGIASVIVLLFLLLMSSTLVSHAEGLLYADEIIFRKQSPYQRIVLTRGVTDKIHRLYLDGHLQFSEKDEYRYHESLVHPIMSIPGRKSKVLILGGGDGMAARELLKYPSITHIDLVDLDPAVTSLCSTLPKLAQLNNQSLDHPKLTLHHTDAMNYLRHQNQTYDRVIIDLPDPHNEALSKLYSVEFYRLLSQSLTDDGVFVTQSTSPWVTRKSYWSIADTIEAAGFTIQSYHVSIPSFGIWGFHMGGRSDPIPHGLDSKIERRFLNPTMLSNAFEFSDDMTRIEGGINSLFEPILYLMYLKELNS